MKKNNGQKKLRSPSTTKEKLFRITGQVRQFCSFEDALNNFQAEYSWEILVDDLSTLNNDFRFPLSRK